MRLSIMSEMPYDTVVDMTHNERIILADVIQEKIAAQNPNKKSQKLVPGKISGP